METLITAVDTIGIPALCIVCLMYFTWQREKKNDERYDALVTRVKELEDEIRKELITLVKDATEAMNDCRRNR